MMDDSGGGAPIIRVVRKKAHHDEHHGGAWKVAYADFVTAMMAFFLVMWVVGMDQSAKDVVQAYFNNPMGYRDQMGLGDSDFAGGSPIPMNAQSSLFDMLQRRHSEERRRLEDTADRLRETLSDLMVKEGLTASVDVEVRNDGLRIELVEAGEGPTFFASGSATLTGPAQKVLGAIAGELASQPNAVIVEGHTDSRPLSQRGYSNWELSNDRANAARRDLERAGLAAARIAEVRGYADRRLRVPSSPEDPQNRRVTIFLPFMNEAPTRPTPSVSIPNGTE